MNPSDYRLLLETAYGEWKRCHARYLDLVCQVAGGAKVPPATAVKVRADVERAMADLACMSHGINAARSSPGLDEDQHGAWSPLCATPNRSAAPVGAK